MISPKFSENNIAQKTAIVVTTYNPEMLDFSKNLASYAAQVGSVIVCDNSDASSAKEDIKRLLETIPNAALLCFNENLGIAEAQNRGIRLAASLGATYFIEMDQDSSLPGDYVERIIRSYQYLI